jgi:hypothetical protein
MMSEYVSKPGRLCSRKKFRSARVKTPRPFSSRAGREDDAAANNTYEVVSVAEWLGVVLGIITREAPSTAGSFRT